MNGTTISFGNGTSFNITDLLNSNMTFGNNTSFNITQLMNMTGNGTGSFNISAILDMLGGKTTKITFDAKDISQVYLIMQEYHDLFKVVDELHKWDWKYFSNALTLNLNIIVIKLLYNNRIMIVEPMVQRGLPRKDSINPLSKKQNLGILTFYKVRLFNMYETLLEHWKIITHTT